MNTTGWAQSLVIQVYRQYIFQSQLPLILIKFTFIISIYVFMDSSVAALPNGSDNNKTLSAPLNLIGNTHSDSSISLSWNDPNNGETSFQIEKSTASNTGFSLHDSAHKNSDTYLVSGLTSGMTYYFRMRSRGRNGTYSEYTPVIQVITSFDPDTTAPEVTITSPASGTTYTTEQTVTISAAASDNVAVAKVEFYDNGVLQASDFNEPFQYSWSFTANDITNHSWTAIAFDTANNETLSSVVTIDLDINAASFTPATTESLTQWAKQDEPVFDKQQTSHITSDPGVLYDDNSDLFIMTYTTDGPGDTLAIGMLSSSNGIDWTIESSLESQGSPVLSGITGAWDENLETSFPILINNQAYLYYSGYTSETEHANGEGFPAQIGLAIGDLNTREFQRATLNPILTHTPGWYDNDALFSPSIIKHQEKYYMVYVGYCITDCTHPDLKSEGGIFLLGATSDDGRHWLKHNEVLLSFNQLPHGIAYGWEPSFVKKSETEFLIYFTATDANEANTWIAMAQSDNPFGAYQIVPEPIIERNPSSVWEHEEIIAPQVLTKGTEAYMWYTGVNMTATNDWGFFIMHARGTVEN